MRQLDESDDYDPKSKVPTSHAWYSKEFADTKGYSLYKDLGGKDVRVTHLSNEPRYHSDILIDKAYDVQYIGVVRELVRKVKPTPPPLEGAA